MGHSCTASSGRRAIAQKLDPQGQGSLPARIPGLITSTLKKMPMDATRHLQKSHASGWRPRAHDVRGGMRGGPTHMVMGITASTCSHNCAP
jgi:hypothetical protein